MALQAKFQALEELSELKQLVQKCLEPRIRSWSLYTTPPKQASRWPLSSCTSCPYILLQQLEKTMAKLSAVNSSEVHIICSPVPVQVIKDFKPSFYKAGLVPAANVHFSMGNEAAAAHEGSCLRPEVLALEGPAPSNRGLSHHQQQQQEQDEAARQARVIPWSLTFVSTWCQHACNIRRDSLGAEAPRDI